MRLRAKVVYNDVDCKILQEGIVEAETGHKLNKCSLMLFAI